MSDPSEKKKTMGGGALLPTKLALPLSQILYNHNLRVLYYNISLLFVVCLFCLLFIDV